VPIAAGDAGKDALVFAPRGYMTFLAKPSVALGFGAFFLCAATCAHFDEPLLSLAGDWVAGVVLVVGGVLSGRDWLRGRQYQVVGWAFIVSLLLHSFLGNLQDLVTSAPEATGSTGLVALSLGPYLVIVGLLLVVSVGGLLTTLAQGSRAA
jgi:hypothetical protein